MSSYWDRFAKFYTGIGDADFWLKHRLCLIEGLSGRVLEVCCGGGRLVLEMLKKNIDAYGIDLSPNMVNTAKSKLSEAGFPPERILEADVTHLPYQDGEFDVVISTGAIGLFKPPMQVKAIQEIARVARLEIRLLEPFEKKKGLYGGRMLAFMFDGNRPIPATTFQELSLDFNVEWDAIGGVFSYIRCTKR